MQNGCSNPLHAQFERGGIPSQAVGAHAVRVNLAGNFISSLVTPKSITPLERLFRKNAVSGVFTASPTRPFRFELGTLDVPQSMSFVLLDYRYAIYAPSGVAAGDTYELEDGRISTSVGYDLTFSGSRMADIAYQLEPVDPQPSVASSFSPDSNAGSIPGNGISGVPPSLFDQIRADSSAASANVALSTQPQRHRRDAQLAMPFTYIVAANKRVSLSVVVFRPIPFPISFFQGELSGFLIAQQALDAFMDKVVPNIKQGSV